MKKLICVLSVVLLVAMNITMAIDVAYTEACAERWTNRVTSLQEVRELNRNLSLAHRYSDHLVESVRMLALENGILCERDKAATEIVVQYEEDNRRLRMSLAEACKRLEEQIGQINDLNDEIENLRWQVSTLERVLNNTASDESIKCDKKGTTEQ